MEKTYFLDTLFDLINESEVLEAELLDICTDGCGLKIVMKDGSAFSIVIEEKSEQW